MCLIPRPWLVASYCLLACQPRPTSSPAASASTAAVAPAPEAAADPVSPPASAPASSSAPAPVEASLAPGQVRFETLASFHDAFVQEGWLVVRDHVDDDAVWQRVLDATQAGESWLWAGTRAIPEAVREPGTFHVVSTNGVAVLDRYGRMAADTSGLLYGYRNTGAKGVAIAMRGAPAERARVRVAAKPKSIKRTHAMAVRMRELLAKADVSPARIARLRGYTLQIVEGSFPGAARVATVSAWASPSAEDDAGDDQGVIFTLTDDDLVQQVVIAGADRTAIEGLVDLDGDGIDEILTVSQGYESASRDLWHVGEDAVEVIGLWSHDE